MRSIGVWLLIFGAFVCNPGQLVSKPLLRANPPSPAYLIQNKVKFSYSAQWGHSFATILTKGSIKVFDRVHQNPEFRESNAFSLGAAMEFSPNFGFSTEIALEDKGVWFDNTVTTISTSGSTLFLISHNQTSIANKYLTIPLMVRFSAGNRARVFIEAGPYLSFLVKSKTHYDSQGIEEYQGLGVPYHDVYPANTFPAFHKTDHGINLAGGLQIPVYRVKFGPVTYLVFQGRVAYGLGDIAEPEQYLTYPVNAPALSFSREVTNFFWQLGVGVRVSMF